MSARRTALLVCLGLLTAAAGFGAVSPSAGAAVVTNAVRCVPPPLNGPAFTWQPQVELTVAPAKDTYSIGDVVTVTWNWRTPPRNPSAWVVIAQNTAQPSGVVRLTGAQTGDVPVSGPQRNPTAWGSNPLYVEPMKGTFTVAKEGRIDLAPAGYTIDTWLIGDPSACTPTGTPAVSTSLAVGTPATPPPSGGTTGGTTGSTAGGSSSGGTITGGTTGGTSGGATPPPAGTPTDPAATGTPGAPGIPGTTAAPGAAAPTGSPGAPAPGAVPGGTPVAEPLPDAQPAGVLPPGAVEGPPGTAPAAANTPRPAGPLFMTPSQDGGVVLGGAPQGGQGGAPGEVAGELRPLTVIDNRGSTLGWTLTGQIGDFVAPDGSVLPGSAFRWTPGCTAASDGSSAVSGGLPGDARANPELLCRQHPSLGEVTGGEFNVEASVRVTLPAPAASQPYTAQLTLTLI